MNDDAEIIAEFLVESHENLDQLDRDLVDLERNPGERELLSSIFRTIHTIKGTSGFLAFNRLEALTHVGENLLSRLRDGQMEMTPPVAEVLLEMVDTVRALLTDVEATGTDSAAEAAGSLDVDVVVGRIKAILNGETLQAEAPEAEAAAPVVEPAPKEAPGEAPAEAPSQQPETDSESSAEVSVTTTAEPAPVDPPAPAPEPVPVAAASPVAPEDDNGEPRRGVVDSTVRVDVDLLDSLVQLVGELVLTRNQILQRTEENGDTDLVRASQRLDLVASELQESVMKTRMQPIGQVWSKMPRIVRDLAHQLGREVNLEMEGHDTELDRSLLEALKGPLTHLVRNSMDHGIEKPETRLAAGKAAQGRLSLRAYHESGQVVVEITDDGKGIDPAAISEVALRRGVITSEQLARMDNRDILGLIFAPGFSTAETVTNVSGRGVGMDVVRTNIERIGGSVDVQSKVGEGTTCRVRIPLTLAIIPALVVGEGAERYAIPQANLVELVRLEGADLQRNVEVLAGAPVLRLRGHLLPLVSLSEVLGLTDATAITQATALTIVVVQADDIRFGLCVAEVHDTQEIVVKPIGRQLKAISMYAGATIMGDGRVSLILDVSGLADAQDIGHVAQQIPESRAADEELASLLVVEISAGRRAALPLREVSRLEEFPHDRIEHTGASEVIQYREGILPLVRLAPALSLPDTSKNHDQVSVVVHETNGHLVGLVIDRVVDVVDTAINRTDVGLRGGVLGSAVIQDRVTDLVDLPAVVALVGKAR